MLAINVLNVIVYHYHCNIYVNKLDICFYISSVRFPIRKYFLSRSVPEEYWSTVTRPDAFHVINHMRGMQYHMVINLRFQTELK